MLNEVEEKNISEMFQKLNHETKRINFKFKLHLFEFRKKNQTQLFPVMIIFSDQLIRVHLPLSLKGNDVISQQRFIDNDFLIYPSS